MEQMPTYLVKKRFWDDEKNLDQETSVKVTNDRNEAVTAFKEILICARNLMNQDADTKDKMTRNECGIQALLFKDGCHHEKVQGHFVEKTFVFVHPEENVVNIEEDMVTFSDRKIVSFLGAGINGFVLECIDTRLDSALAIKVWLKDEKALLESKKLKKAEHPNVVNIKYSGVSEGYIYAELDLINGMTLRNWLKNHPSFHERALVAKQIIETLDHIHDQNIYHGDLHSDNIIITPIQKIKILDFGTSVKSGKKLSNHRAAWILAQTMYELLKPEIDPHLDLLSDHIQDFIKEKRWREIKKNYFSKKLSSLVYPADYVNASFDFMVEFLMAKSFYTDRIINVPLMSDLATFLMRSPFIKYKNLFNHLSSNCKETEIKAFVASMYFSTSFDNEEGMDDALFQLLQRTSNELSGPYGFLDDEEYYKIHNVMFFKHREEYKAWRKFHMSEMKKLGITESLTKT